MALSWACPSKARAALWGVFSARRIGQHRLLISLLGQFARRQLGLFGYRMVLRRPLPLLAPRFEIPTSKSIDGRLVIGAVT